MRRHHQSKAVKASTQLMWSHLALSSLDIVRQAKQLHHQPISIHDAPNKNASVAPVLRRQVQETRRRRRDDAPQQFQPLTIFPTVIVIC